MKCPHCDTENPQSAKFCRTCGNELTDGMNSTPTIMDKFPEYNFQPTKFYEWKKPWLARIRTILFSTVFCLSFSMLCYSILALIFCDSNYKQEESYDGSIYYEAKYSDAFNLYTDWGYGDNYIEALNDARNDYQEIVLLAVLVFFLLSLISVLVIFWGRRKFPSKNNKLRDVADYVEKYRYTGFIRGRKKPILKFYVKDNEMGLLDVAHYNVFLPAQYDILAWREKNKYLNATLNDSSFVIDIYGEKLK